MNFLPGGPQLDVLRLDMLHPIVSGNKWFKLKLQLQDAKQKNHTAIATFGGAFSNHIVAAAFAGKAINLQTIGIIRGEEPTLLSHTLQQAQAFGMKLHFASREGYSNKDSIKKQFSNENFYWINEGGCSILGAEGVKEMYQWIDDSYTHIVCATGTGTMMAGLIKGSKSEQQVIGINVFKGYNNIVNDIEQLLTAEEKVKRFKVINGYDFGGYAKHPQALLDWMNALYNKEQLPTDIVYTSKMMYAIYDLIQQNYFTKESKIMAIHSGGLQGNLSLKESVLKFGN